MGDGLARANTSEEIIALVQAIALVQGKVMGVGDWRTVYLFSQLVIFA